MLLKRTWNEMWWSKGLTTGKNRHQENTNHKASESERGHGNYFRPNKQLPLISLILEAQVDVILLLVR